MTALAAVVAALVLAVPQAAVSRQLESDAWRAVQERRAADAEDLFRQLTNQRPDDARAWLGWAAAALLRGRDDDARPRLERALTLAPSNVDAALLLADVFYRQGRAEDAIRVLDRARSAGADDSALTSRLARLTAERELHDGFSASGNARFVVLFEGAPEQAMAEAVLRRLDAAWTRVSSTLFTPPGGPVTVTLYTEEQFVDITRAPAWAVGAFDGSIRVPMRGALDDEAELDRVLTHELAHAFVRAAARRHVPVWLDEGIASVVEPRGLDWARAEVRAAGRLLATERLRGPFRDLDADSARLAYAQSALLVEAMLARHPPAALNALIGDLGRGVPLEQAFRSRMYESFDAFVEGFARDWGVPYDRSR